MFIFLTCASMSSISMEVVLDSALLLLLELVLLFVMYSLAIKSISWLLSERLSGILFGLLLFLSMIMFRSAASIWSVEKLLTCFGLSFFVISKVYSFRSSFTFIVNPFRPRNLSDRTWKPCFWSCYLSNSDLLLRYFSCETFMAPTSAMGSDQSSEKYCSRAKNHV